MARRPQSKGTCAYCDKVLSKGGMTRHLSSCTKRQEAIAQADAGKGKVQTIYHLRVQDAYKSSFWLNLEMSETRKLEDLDFYLREIWLECCGHLSEFFGVGGFGHTVAMSRSIRQAVQSNPKLTHIYDFGTSSETVVTVLDTRKGKPLTKQAIALLARNNMPETECIECGQVATHLCQQCIYDDGVFGTLCDEHVESHPHDDYGDPVPLLNSPRVGMCGYAGPAEPPY